MSLKLVFPNSNLVYVAIKMLVADKNRFIGLVAGLALVSFLVAQQASIFYGFVQKMTAWIVDANEVDLWVMHQHAEFSESSLPLSDNVLFRVRSTPGVAFASRLIKDRVQAKLPNGQTITARLIGIDDASLIGGPVSVNSNDISRIRENFGILVDQADLDTKLAFDTNNNKSERLKIGNKIILNDFETKIVDFYRKTNEFFWEPVFYSTYSTASIITPPNQKKITFVLVGIKPGYKLKDVLNNIKESTKLKVLTGSEFAAMNRDFILGKTGILVNFGITIILGLFIGILISGHLIQSFVALNMTHYATMKTMGVSGYQLLVMLFIQIALVSFLGIAIGIGIASIGSVFLVGSSLSTYMVWHVPLITYFSILICTLISGGAAIKKVINLDPAQVFRQG